MDLDLNPFYIALYPEIHHTFDLFFSRLRHSQPEILVDCPHRIDPGKTIPLLCLVKHANTFPIVFQSVLVEMEYEDGIQEKKLVWNSPEYTQNYLWFRVFHLEPKRDYSGDVLITARIQTERDGCINSIVNHNYRGIKKLPLKVHIGREPLPSHENWYYGESHYHSFHSDDQVEFGAPIKATVEMAEALGLKWLAVTDHSYDLDDLYSHTLYHDENLLKWKTLKEEIEAINSNAHFQVIPGEEISCGNARNKNVHLLAYGIENFIPGKGDGAEKWFRTRPDLPLGDVLKKVKAEGGVAYASHPEVRFTLGERFMLRRGHWEDADYNLPDYCGLQFWNGKQDKAFYEGYKQWVEMLLKGRRLFFIGGDDSHGDFNVFRQIRVPLLKMIHSPHKVFGKIRTCLYCKEGLSQQSILQALKNGTSFVTSGPFITCYAITDQGGRASVGGEISGTEITVYITAKSTDEYGDITNIRLYEGNLRDRIEKHREFYPRSHFHDPKNITLKGIPLQVKGPLYIRLEAVSRKGKESYYAYTNPIWLNPTSIR